MTKEEVLAALGKVQEPDLKNDIVTLNMFKDISIEGNKVSFTLILTTPACPLKDKMKNDSVAALREINPAAEVEINFTSNTTSNRMDAKSVLKGVKNIIAVVSGKGGVGKSTVSANLALALGESGAKVGLMDADIYGPSQHIMFGIRGEKPMMRDNGSGKGVIIPIDRYGIKVMSIGLLVDEKQAVVWRGPMVSSAIRQFVSEVDWGELDYLIIDMPPGTGDIHLTVVQTIPVTGVIVVTTPQLVALADAKKGIAMFNQARINVPVIGLVENMSYFTPAELPDNKYYIFGKHGGKNLAEEYDVPLLGEIPLVQSIREGGDLGVPVMIGDDEISRKAFKEFADNSVRGIAMRNANMPATEISQVR